jgi:hypothetical protein
MLHSILLCDSLRSLRPQLELVDHVLIALDSHSDLICTFVSLGERTGTRDIRGDWIWGWEDSMLSRVEARSTGEKISPVDA